MSTTPDIILRIRDNIRDSGPGVRYDDEVIVRSGINPTLREMEARTLSRLVSATISSVAGQGIYALPASIRTAYLFEGVFYGTSKIPLRWREHNENAAYIGGNGIPRWWSIVGAKNDLELSPAPNASGDNIFVEAYASPSLATPVSSTDELSLALDTEDCLISGASWRMAVIDSEIAKADRFFGQYRDRISLLRQKLAPDRGDLPSIVDGSGFDEAYLAL